MNFTNKELKNYDLFLSSLKIIEDINKIDDDFIYSQMISWFYVYFRDFLNFDFLKWEIWDKLSKHISTFREIIDFCKYKKVNWQNFKNKNFYSEDLEKIIFVLKQELENYIYWRKVDLKLLDDTENYFLNKYDAWYFKN